MIGTAGMAGIASTISNRLIAKPAEQNSIAPGNTILFQGDSITDAGRDKKNQVANLQKSFGGGYAWMAASNLLVTSPHLNLRIYNRGISGNKVHQLAARWDRDCLDLKPDLVDPICYELDDIWECNSKEDHLTPAEYDKLRTENLDWLSGKEK